MSDLHTYTIRPLSRDEIDLLCKGLRKACHAHDEDNRKRQVGPACGVCAEQREEAELCRALARGRNVAIFNPQNKPVEELPVIYGFNNGGIPGFYDATLIAEDGTFLGGHLCSNERYMLSDLGILEGFRPDRHERFKAHYPNGYQMDFVSYEDVQSHAGITAAIERAAPPPPPNMEGR